MAAMLAIRLSDVNARAKIADPITLRRVFPMSVLAVFAFSETSIAFRRRAVQWSCEVLFPAASVAVPSGRPALLRDAGICQEAVDMAHMQPLARDAVYRSHWLL